MQPSGEVLAEFLHGQYLTVVHTRRERLNLKTMHRTLPFGMVLTSGVEVAPATLEVLGLDTGFMSDRT